MATLAEVNMTLQEQGETLRETHQTLLGMLQEDINARKKEERAAGDRREKEREAKNRRQGPPSVKGMGSGEAFTRGLLGDKMFGSLDNLMSMAFGAAGGLIPFAFKNIGRGLKFGAAALALNSLTESAVDFAFEQLEKVGITGLTPDQKAQVAAKAETAVNAGFVAKFLGLGNKASLAVALGAAFGEEIGIWLGGVVDENGNLRLKIPFADYMGYPEGEITLGPAGQAALGAISLLVGQKILGASVKGTYNLLKKAKPGFWTRLFKGLTGVSLVQMATEAITKDGTRTVPQPNQFNEPGRGPIRYPQRVAPTAINPTQGKPTVGRDPKTGRFTSLRNTVPNAFNEPGRGPITYPQAANTNVAPKQPKNMAEWLRSADQKIVNSRAFQRALPILKAMAKAAPWAAFAVFLNEFVTIIGSNMSVKEKRAATARLIGGTFQVTVIAAFGASVGALSATALGVTAGWGTVLGLIGGGLVGLVTPNYIGDMLAALLVGDNDPAKDSVREEQLLMQRGVSGNALKPLGFAGSTIDESASYFESVKNDPNYAPRAFELRQQRIKQMSMYGSRYRGLAGRDLGADLGIGFNPNRTADDVSLLNEIMRLKQPTIVINNDNSTTDNSSAYKAEGNRYLTGTGMTATDLKYDKMYMGIKGFGGSVGQVF